MEHFDCKAIVIVNFYSKLLEFLCRFFIVIAFFSCFFIEKDLFCVSSGMSYDKLPEQKWTWSYKKVFSDSEMLKNSSLNQVLFFKENVKNFSQLIFSWNCKQPKIGGISCYINTRNAETKKWNGWHKMFDWSKNMKKSYFSCNQSSQYVHVRFETGSKELADAFKIVIKSFGDADLGVLKSVCASVSDFNKFKYEVLDGKFSKLKSVHIKSVPKISQRLVDHKDSFRICSPVSCSMLAGYLNKNFINPIEFADNVFDCGLGELGSYGNWAFNVAELYNRCNCKILFCVQRLNAFIDLYEKLVSGFPVVVSVRGKLDGGQKVYNNGHLIVVVGWDASDKTVICHDPAFYTSDSTLVKYGLGTFVRGWESSNRLAYVASSI